MGKGDKKTGKGKRFMGSFGNTRKKKKSVSLLSSLPVKKSAEKKTETKKTTAKKSASKKSKESNEK